MSAKDSKNNRICPKSYATTYKTYYSYNPTYRIKYSYKKEYVNYKPKTVVTYYSSGGGSGGAIGGVVGLCCCAGIGVAIWFMCCKSKQQQ